MKSLPQRQHSRLKEFDYSQSGYYYITVCTKHNAAILSKIIVGRGLAPAEVKLTALGKLVKEQLMELPIRYRYVCIDKYVIMPTHLHAIIKLEKETAGASPRPTLIDIVCAFKSLSTRLCNQHDNIRGRSIWQTSFYEKIIRDEMGYREIWQYIDDNPTKWDEDEYYHR